MDPRGASTNGMGLVGLRLRIGVVVEVLGRSHAPAGEKGKAAAIGNAIDSGDLAYTACALEGRGGAYMVQGHGGTQHGGIDGGSSHRWVGICYPAPQRLTRVLDRAGRPIQVYI